MKPYYKGIKFFGFIIVIILGTFCFIRKKDKLSLNIEESIKNNMEVSKNYLAIENSKLRKLNKVDIKKLQTHNIQYKAKPEILTLEHKCRINDTLYFVQIFVDNASNIKYVDKPKKAF